MPRHPTIQKTPFHLVGKQPREDATLKSLREAAKKRDAAREAAKEKAK